MKFRFTLSEQKEYHYGQTNYNNDSSNIVNFATLHCVMSLFYTTKLFLVRLTFILPIKLYFLWQLQKV